MRSARDDLRILKAKGPLDATLEVVGGIFFCCFIVGFGVVVGVFGSIVVGLLLLAAGML